MVAPSSIVMSSMHHRPEGVELGAHRVTADRERRRRGAAVLSGQSRALESGLRVHQRDAHTRKGQRGFVDDDDAKVAGGGARLRVPVESGPRQAENKRRGRASHHRDDDFTAAAAN